MTFQIGALGDEGIVLGSDKRATDEHGGWVRTTYDTPKIKMFDDLRLAYCWAGDALARYAAESIVSAIRKEDKSQILESPRCWLNGTIGNAIADGWDSEYRADAKTKGELLNGGTILLVYRGPAPDGIVLWDIRIGKCSMACPVDGRFVASGDRTSSALFLMERYYPKAGKPPMEVLKNMVAACILFASDVNPAAVSGLELLVCKPDGFTHLSSDTDKAPFIEAAKKLDRSIAESLGLDYRTVIEDPRQ